MICPVPDTPRERGSEDGDKDTSKKEKRSGLCLSARSRWDQLAPADTFLNGLSEEVKSRLITADHPNDLKDSRLTLSSRINKALPERSRLGSPSMGRVLTQSTSDKSFQSFCCVWWADPDPLQSPFTAPAPKAEDHENTRSQNGIIVEWMDKCYVMVENDPPHHRWPAVMATAAVHRKATGYCEGSKRDGGDFESVWTGGVHPSPPPWNRRDRDNHGALLLCF